ncbi:MAG: helix-turn-helix domain-containing protein [Desulfobacterales bacterium]|nr:helix-turn-helix domain-containing protein [Desulfobacterales bacterium]
MNVYIFGFDEAYASSMVGLMDIFQRAEQLLQQQSHAKELTVKLASADGKPILCQNNILLNVHCSLEDIQQADIFIITAVHDVDAILPKYRFVVDWLKEQYKKGAILISICTGAFLLAETGLLDGKEATTHWSIADLFRERYPAIQLKPEKLIINHGNLYCSAGAGSGNDLVYYLLEKYLGHSLASKTAKFFVHDFRRASQCAYTIYNTKTGHNDTQILETQHWISKHLTEPSNIKKLSDIACMSQRTFERRFKKATGDSPIVYIQRLKVETAKQQLETTNLSFDEISYKMGYLNSGSFRKIFVKWVHLLPSEYRERFQAYN